MRNRPGALALLSTTILLPACVSTQGMHMEKRPGQVYVISEELRPSYDLLMRESKSFRAAMQQVERNGFRIVIGYQDDFEDPYPDPVFGSVAGVDPLLYDHGFDRYYGVNVVFFTRRTEAAARAVGVSQETITRELAVVLAHEIYGHVVPSVTQRLYPSPCQDPNWEVGIHEAGCAVERENIIRAEIGFPLRPRYLHLDLSFFCAVNADTCDRLNSQAGLAQSEP